MILLHQPRSGLPLAPRSRSWDGNAARQRMVESARNSAGQINVTQASRGFLFVRNDGQNQGDYVAPFADVIDGRLHVVFGGVIAALQRINQIEGVPAEEIASGRSFLERQRDRFNESEAGTYRLPSTLSTIPIKSAIANLRVNGRPFVTEDWRTPLLAMLQSNSVSAVEFDIVAFIQGPNANHYAFRDEELNYFAESFIIQPFLRNHDTRDIDSRDGTIMHSMNVDGQFVQTVKLTTQRGIKSLAEGQIDRFSIGWDFDQALCSICNQDYTSFHSCPHIAGQTYNNITCNVLFTSPTGTETSAVNVPAVSGTRILDALLSKKNHILKSEDYMNDDELETGEELEEELTPEPEPVAEQRPALERMQQTAAALAPMILAQIVQNPELQSAFANAFHLPDIDNRLGMVEVATQGAIASIEDMAHVLAQLDGGLPQGDYTFTHDELTSLGNWNGYKGSTLSEAPTAPNPPQNIRRPLALQQKQGRKTAMSMREQRGAEVLGLWNEGGE